jgi:hypothetical protein
MAKIWMYVLGANSNPDCVRCQVPWRVDEKLIFFGPCKKGIRKCLRKMFLGPNRSHQMVTEELFIVGVNTLGRVKKRKVVWWGKLSEVMTFAEADKRLKGDRFQKLRNHRCSPLHVRPVLEDGMLIGYKHKSDEHIKKEEWVSDLVSKSARPDVLVKGRQLTLKQGKPWQAFDRDCCMLLENRFFALGKDIQPGIEFDEEAMDILREAQPETCHIDDPAIFGRDTNGKVIGLRGHFLEIPKNLTNCFFAWLESRSPERVKHEWSQEFGPAKTSCA